MNKYGLAALIAIELIQSRKAHNPVQAWEMATIEIFGRGTSSQSKGCPKNTFLALCETGKIKGVEAGAYTRSLKNKGYAMKALTLLQSDPLYSKDPKALWNAVQGENYKNHNSQMDVVSVLWTNGLIK